MKRTPWVLLFALVACGDDSAAVDAGGQDVAASDAPQTDAAQDAPTPDAPEDDAGDAGPDMDASLDTGPVDGGSDARDGGPTAPAPKRLLVLQTPHGVIPERWTPSATGRDFDFNEMMAPLEAIREDVTIISGMDFMPYEGEGRSNAVHGYGPAAMLTGILGSEGPMGIVSKLFLGGGPSIDRVVGSDETTFRSINLDAGRLRGSLLPFHFISWNDADEPAPPLTPDEAYQRLFSGFAPLPPEVAALEVRALPYAGDAVPTVEVQFDIAFNALRYDLTRAITIQTGHGSPVSVFSSLGHTRDWHSITHEGDAAGDELVEIWAFFAAQIVELANELRAVSEGTGTMLDNTLIVWISEAGLARAHLARDIPIVLVGNIDGAIDSGQHVAMSDDRFHNDLLLTIVQLFDPTITTFGDARYVTGPIMEILR